MRGWWWKVTGTVLLVYGAMIGGAKFMERELVFRAAHAKARLTEPQGAYAPPHTRVEFAAADSTKLVGWVIPAAPVDSNGVWVLYCHGNAHNLSQYEEPEFYAYLRALGVNILTFDYRGFGESTGAPDEQGSYADAHAAYDLLRTKYQVSPSRIVIYGHSLGTGVAVQLASTVPAGALILQVPYTSIPDLGADRFWYLPVRAMATYRFPSIDRIASVTAPLLVLASPQDAVIPVAMGERLHLAAGSIDKRLIHVMGGHEIAFRVDSGIFFRAFREMVGTVAKASGPVSAVPRPDTLTTRARSGTRG